MNFLRNTLYGGWEYIWKDPLKYYIVKERLYLLPWGQFKITRKETYDCATWKTTERGTFKYDATSKTITLRYSGNNPHLEEIWHNVTLQENHLSFKESNGKEWIYNRKF